ncbi:hypothetical protein [Oleisolibacter albus]|uniref:hypothetical protein n=1 Tax=Oleisolibacter albus TaxID=2171757 RepID=UPI0012D7211B|nr:hypothetical protein [Oleisolibacter albus]
MGLSGLLLAAGLLAGPAQAQPRGGRDPDFPCVQVLVPSLSPGQIWSGPPVDDIPAGAWTSDTEVRRLVEMAGDRRVGTEALTSEIDRFAGTTKDGNRLVLLFAGVFETLQAERGQSLDAIRRYAQGQRQMLDRIAARLRDQQDLSADDPRRAEIADAIAWDRRVLEDRRRMLPPLCERPALLERRLGAVARTLAAHLPP